MHKCKICGYETETIRGLVSHIIGLHKINIQSYYIQYIDNNIPKCICGKNTTFISITQGFSKFCCKKCANSYNTLKRWEQDPNSFNTEDRIKTTIKLYGGCGFASEKIMKKIKLTNKKLHNDENYCNRTKAEKTIETLYGDSNIFKTEHFKKESKHTKKDLYNDENYNNRELYIKTMLDRYGYTNYDNIEHNKKVKKERYNDENYNNREKAYKTCKEKYGYEIPFNKPIKYKGIYFDSMWEIYYYEFLTKYNIPFIYHPDPIEYYWSGDNKFHKYYPDFLVYGTYIEIKNDYLYEKMLINGTQENAKLQKMKELHTIILKLNELKDIIKEMKGIIHL